MEKLVDTNPRPYESDEIVIESDSLDCHFIGYFSHYVFSFLEKDVDTSYRKLAT